MDSNSGVADQGQYPGTVLEPNAEITPNQAADNLQQFGQELERPNAVKPSASAVDENGIPTDPTERGRWQYHQSQADQAKAKLAEVEKKLAERQKYDPLVDLLKTDEEAYRMLQSRLTGSRQSSEKPLEMPQKPDSYNEVEAYSNPESSSFKYRKEVEAYKDAMLVNLSKQNQMLFQQREQERMELERQAAQREALNKFKNDVVSRGIADQEFAEFFNLVNNASQDDMISYFKWKKSQSTQPQGFNFPPTVSAGMPYDKPASSRGGNVDIGSEMLAFSKHM